MCCCLLHGVVVWWMVGLIVWSWLFWVGEWVGVAFVYCDCWYCLICMLFGVLIGLGLGLYTLRVIVLLVGLLWLWVFGFCYVFLVVTRLMRLCFDCLVCWLVVCWLFSCCLF